MPAMPPPPPLPGMMPACAAVQEGAAAKCSGPEDALAFAALLATLAAPDQIASEPHEPETAWRSAAEPEQGGRDEGSDTDDPHEGTAVRALIAAFAVQAPLWWMAAVRDVAGGPGAPEAQQATTGVALRAREGEAGFAADSLQKAVESESVPALTTVAGRPEQTRSAMTAEVAPLAPPESLRAAAEADAGQPLQAPVSLGLRLEARNPLGSSLHGSVAAADGSPAAASSQVAAHAPAAGPRAQPVMSESRLQAPAPAQPEGPGARAEAEPTPLTADALGQTANARPRGRDLEQAAGGFRAESRPAGEVMSVTPAAASVETPQPALGRQPHAERGGPPAAVQRLEAEASSASEAPREVWLRLRPGKAGEHGRAAVVVQLTERAGRIEVRVRTPDPALGESLRREVPALVERLEREGFRATALEAAALTAPSEGGALRIAQPENAPAFEDERWRGGEGLAGRQGSQREQGQARREEGENANFVSEVKRWLHR